MSNNQLEFFLPACPDITVERKIPQSEKPALFLLDGMAIIYRAFFALQRAGMTSRDGMPTGAIYGFASALFKIFEIYKPHYLAAVFDSKEKTFRHDIYPAYKANRQAPPEDLIMQLDAVFELLDALDIPLLKTPGFEADDLIGTASRKFEDICRIYIVTPDKDLAQLVHEGVKILRPGKNQNELELLGQKEIAEQFGVPPALFTQFLTLTGDNSDNIPGAKGIGPKTASALLDKYGSLQNMYNHLDKISPKNRKSLEEFQPKLDLITELVTIRTDLQMDVTLKELECGNRIRQDSCRCCRNSALKPLYLDSQLFSMICRNTLLMMFHSMSIQLSKRRRKNLISDHRSLVRTTASSIHKKEWMIFSVLFKMSIAWRSIRKQQVLIRLKLNWPVYHFPLKLEKPVLSPLHQGLFKEKPLLKN